MIQFISSFNFSKMPHFLIRGSVVHVHNNSLSLGFITLLLNAITDINTLILSYNLRMNEYDLLIIYVLLFDIYVFMLFVCFFGHIWLRWYCIIVIEDPLENEMAHLKALFLIQNFPHVLSVQYLRNMMGHCCITQYATFNLPVILHN